MLELFTLAQVAQSYSDLNEGLEHNTLPTKMPLSWIITILIISFGSAYIAYCCNEYEKPATRALSTIIAFFFSGIYLVYYFIVHVLFDRKCSSRGINNIIKNLKK